MQKIVLATSNPGKVKELSELLAPAQFEVIPQSQFNLIDAEETGTTFVENAILKARHAARLTGLPAIADDSGLAVDALQGAPGIYSARYSGQGANDATNIEKLLGELEGIPFEQRGAEFHCVLVFMRHADDPTPLICHGRWRGVITQSIEGDGGFGYDPVFWVTSAGKTSAQLTKAEKNALSHRGQALRQLVQKLA
jgi:XTP/dITP diphosphohydrolase